ncbi:chondroitinase-B domain-containing protein [Lutibacter sp. TH_r2]|uniref:chondroitinase-B domain-containing protein n=1 Tax=Lutibacter sp. TH_r2 TaxID=3082083 RepID=UPI002955452E|nr:chondroitinase-B domain-containing protein [Lutibacter sp. TH_r2]MDV7188359.1 chondroitinase-B domain-containing protein [Lutibacter sp. TH_r2]
MKNYYLLKLYSKFIFGILFLFSTSVFSQNMTYNIDDPEALRDVIYQPGDLIILKNGTYTTDERMRFLGSGTEENPVVFRAETPGGVIFTGGPRLTIGGETDDDTGDVIATGEYLVVDGFHWKGGYGASNFIEFRNGYNFAHYSTIQNCAIDGLGVDPQELEEGLNPADPEDSPAIEKHRWIVLYGTHNTVINCSFMNKQTAGAIILAEYAYNAWGPPYDEPEDGEPDNGFETVNTRCDLVGHTISNNYFYNFEKMLELYADYVDDEGNISNAGDSETIRIGTSEYQMVNSGATVSNNYFVQADGENEIITNKSKNNTYTNNTFRRSRGSLVLRHGSNATVDGNYFLGENVDGTGGIRITDSDHTITNNYIQDCVTTVSQAKWNNGITFIGGSADPAVDCSEEDASNGYQQTENIILSNNTIMNTYSPLFYNVDKGSTDPTGTVANNLIYFETGNQNITDVISGDTETSFANLGTALTYTGNVFTGTTLGEDLDVTEFSEETGITATASGDDIFTFSGTGSEGKGADMGSYAPTTDEMVGYGIGACFLDFEGLNISDGDCNIEIPESLTVGSLSTLGYEASSDNEVSVTANVIWTAESNDTWITIDGSDTTSGTGNATVLVSVTANVELSVRTGTVTFTGEGTDGDIIKTLTITQEGAPRSNLINTGEEDDPVSIFFVSKENTSKSELAINTLDKDMGSVWTADDGDVLTGDYKGDGEYIIYNLGDIYTLDFIQFNTTNKSDAFGFQFLVSTTGTEDSDFSLILPTSGDLLFTATGTTEFNEYEVSAEAQYVKVIGYGRFNASGDNRESAWSAIGEIEFYGDKVLSVDDYEFSKNILVYPVPAKGNLNIKILNNNSINSIKLFSLNGRLVKEKEVNSLESDAFINVEELSSGTYILNLSNTNKLNISRLIIVTD